jgi:hypothetical protein
MDALDPNANPLLAAYLNPQTIPRAQLLLSPPFLDSSGDHRPGGYASKLVWKNFVSGAPPRNRTDDWKNQFEIERFYPDPWGEAFPRFKSNPAYEEIDVTVGKFTLKGIVSLRNLFWRWLRQYRKSVVGVVTGPKVEGKHVWSVRLNANVPPTDWTASVYADGLPQEYGDPLGQVAQRAAFKLVLRMVNPYLTANEVTARASYRQGIQLLEQIV